jgi:hypothetical protein
MPFTVKKIKGIDTSSLDKLGNSVVDLAKYTEDEFSQVASALQGTEAVTVWNVPPPRPRKGTMAYADGTHWNPGSGEGFYEYTSGGVWVPMFVSPSAPVVTSIAGNTGAFTLNAASGITNVANDIRLSPASAAQFGAVKPDGTTITAAAGVISAVQPAAGSWVLLNTLTASNSATLSDTTSFTGTYNEYEIVFVDLIAATTANTLTLQVHSGGSFRNTGYSSADGYTSGSALAQNSSTTGILCSVGGGVSNAIPMSGSIRVNNPTVAAQHAWWGTSYAGQTGGGVNYPAFFGGIWNTAAAIDGFQVLMSGGGNITSGKVKIYGRL